MTARLLAVLVFSALPARALPRRASPPPSRLPAAAPLRRLAGEIAKASPAAPVEPGAFSVFDGARRARPWATGAETLPAMPGGVSWASVDPVSTPAEMKKVTGASPRRFKRLLAAGSLRVFTYHDDRGGRFFAVETPRRAKTVELLPVDPYEARAIRRLLSRHAHVLLLLPNHLKTPDLLVDGLTVELKRRSAPLKDARQLPAVLRGANMQVLAYANRHGLGLGALVITLLGDPRVPLETVRDGLNLWAERTRAPILLGRVLVLARSGWKEFARGEDGVFRLVKNGCGML